MSDTDTSRLASSGVADPQDQRRALRLRLVIAAMVAILLVSAVVGAVARGGAHHKAGPAERALQLERAGIKVCTAAGLSTARCDRLGSGGSTETRQVRDWCRGLSQLGTATGELATNASRDMDHHPLVELVRHAADQAVLIAPPAVKADMTLTARAVKATLDAYESQGRNGDLVTAAAAVSPDVQSQAKTASAHVSSYSRAHCA